MKVLYTFSRETVTFLRAKVCSGCCTTTVSMVGQKNEDSSNAIEKTMSTFAELIRQKSFQENKSINVGKKEVIPQYLKMLDY